MRAPLCSECGAPDAVRTVIKDRSAGRYSDDDRVVRSRPLCASCYQAVVESVHHEDIASLFQSAEARVIVLSADRVGAVPFDPGLATDRAHDHESERESVGGRGGPDRSEGIDSTSVHDAGSESAAADPADSARSAGED